MKLEKLEVLERLCPWISSDQLILIRISTLPEEDVPDYNIDIRRVCSAGMMPQWTLFLPIRSPRANTFDRRVWRHRASYRHKSTSRFGLGQGVHHVRIGSRFGRRSCTLPLSMFFPIFAVPNLRSTTRSKRVRVVVRAVDSLYQHNYVEVQLVVFLLRAIALLVVAA